MLLYERQRSPFSGEVTALAASSPFGLGREASPEPAGESVGLLPGDADHREVFARVAVGVFPFPERLLGHLHHVRVGLDEFLELLDRHVALHHADMRIEFHQVGGTLVGEGRRTRVIGAHRCGDEFAEIDLGPFFFGDDVVGPGIGFEHDVGHVLYAVFVLVERIGRVVAGCKGRGGQNCKAECIAFHLFVGRFGVSSIRCSA